MNSIPTESRIFADRCSRELRRLEKLHAGYIAPGSATWSAALEAVHDRMAKARSPIKTATMVHDLAAYLDGVPADQRAHLVVEHSGGSRSATLTVATYYAGGNPLAGVDEDGVNVEMHQMQSDRHGAGFVATGLPLAYLSTHAMARLHQRESATSEQNFLNTIGLVAALAFMIRLSAKHVGGQLCIALDESLIVGSVKHALQRCSDGSSRIGSILDVRTVLPLDDLRESSARQQAMIDQGEAAFEAVRAWFGSEPGSDEDLADGIPALPCDRTDYSSVAATAHVMRARQAAEGRAT